MSRTALMGSLAAVLLVVAASCGPPLAQPLKQVGSGDLVRMIAPPEEALTFAQIKESGRVVTLLVLEERVGTIRAIDLSARFDLYDRDSLELLDVVGRARILSAARDNGRLISEYPLVHVLPAGGTGGVHVAAGTNYREHAHEVGIGRVFSFPKFAPPTPHITSVGTRAGMLLDYETEICARFDRDLRSLEDFDHAVVGFFLCDDYTDRAVLTRLIDRNDLSSGVGYTDAKSGPDFFPSGPYLVVPIDWRSFVARERITTTLRGERRQDATGAEMIDDLRTIVSNALANGAEKRWRYRGQAVALLDGGVLQRGSAVLTGTPAGIIFRPPSFVQKATGFLAYAFGGFLSGRSPVDYVIERFLSQLEKSKVFLQPGEVVEHSSAHLGTITVSIR